LHTRQFDIKQKLVLLYILLIDLVFGSDFVKLDLPEANLWFYGSVFHRLDSIFSPFEPCLSHCEEKSLKNIVTS